MENPRRANRKGQKTDRQPVADTYNLDDGQPNILKNSCGVIEFHGVARFYPNVKLPDSFEANNRLTMAGQLPSTTDTHAADG